MSGLGGMIADLQQRGISPRQHFDPEWPIPERIVTYSARVVMNPKRDPLDLAGPDIEDPEILEGDDLGWHLWEAKSKADRSCSAWFSGTAPAAVLAGEVVPLRRPDEPDARFKGRAQSSPSWATQFPDLWTGTSGAGSEEYEQAETWHPDFLGLVAVNKAGSPRFGSRVFDLTAASAVDAGRWAYLQSLVSVVPLAGGGCGVGGDALAIQLGKSGQDRLSGGALFTEWLEPQRGAGTVTRKNKRGPKKVNAVGSWKLGSGPFLSGGKGDVHELGVDGDGDPINALHLSILALWKGGEGDGPLAFTGDPWVEPEGDGPVWQRTYLRWNPARTHPFCKGSRPGLWEWETPTWIMAALPPDPPPEVDPQPPKGDPKPPPPGGEEPPPVPPPPHPPVGYVHSDTPELIGDEAPPRPNYAEIANCLVLGGLLTRAHAWGTGARDMSGTGTISSEDRQLLANAPVVSHVKGFAPGRSGDGSWWDWLYTDIGGGNPLAIPAAGAGPVFLPPDRSLEDAINDEAYSGPGSTIYIPTKTTVLAFGNPSPTGTLQDGVTIRPDGAGDLAIEVYSGGTNTASYSTADFGGSSSGDGNVFTSSTTGASSQRGESTDIFDEAVDGGAITIFDLLVINGGDTGVRIVDVLATVLADFNGSGVTASDTILVGTPASTSRWGNTGVGGYVAGSENAYTTDPVQWIAPGGSLTIRISASAFTFNGSTGKIRVSVIYEQSTHPTS